MQPALMDGEWAIALRRPPQIGDIVVLEHPQRPGFELVKRVSGRDDDGNLFLRGDNATASSDSRSFGAVPPASVRGVISIVYFPPERARLADAPPAGR